MSNSNYRVVFYLMVKVFLKTVFLKREFSFDFVPMVGVTYTYQEWECNADEVLYDIETRTFSCYQAGEDLTDLKNVKLPYDKQIQLLDSRVEEYLAKGWERDEKGSE